MAEIIDTRPFYKKKSFYADAIYIIGSAVALAPGAPVLFTVGAVGVTTVMVGVLTTGIGYLFGNYAKAKRIERLTGKK